MNSVSSIALKLAAVAAVAYFALVALVYWQQERLIFLPSPLPPEHRYTFGSDVHEVSVPVKGAVLSALHLKLPNPRGVVFYLHGNAGNLETWFSRHGFYRQLNYDLFMIDYRGYGKSTGCITSEAQLHADVRAAWQQIAPRYQGKLVVIMGRSLGSGLAARLAVDLQPAQLVLISPYRSLSAMAREHFAWVPAFALRYPLDTEALAPRINSPVLLIHGERDGLIVPSHSQALKAALPQAQVAMIANAGHNDLQEFDAYTQALASQLTQLPLQAVQTSLLEN